MADFKPQDLASTPWSFAALPSQHPPLMAAISKQARRQMSALKVQDLANMAWALAKLAVADAPLMQAISSAALRSIQHFRPQGLTNTVWAFATLLDVDEPLLQAISASAISKLKDFDPPSLAGMAWSVATLCFEDEPLLAAIAAESRRKIQDFSAQAVANTAWSCARLDISDEPLIAAISAAAIRKSPELLAQNLANIAWACSTLLYTDEPLLHAISSESISKICEFNVQALANTSWALATLGYRDAPLLAAIAAPSITTISEGRCPPQALASIAWAFSSLAFTDAPLLEAISSAAIRSLAEICDGLEEGTHSDSIAGILRLIQALSDAGGAESQAAAEVLAAAEAAFRRGDASGGAAGAEELEGQQRAAADHEREEAGLPETTPCVLLERADLGALWKPPGWTVTVGPGGDEDWSPEAPGLAGGEQRGGARPLQAWALEHLGTVARPIFSDGRVQHGLIHRLDRNTTGLLIYATSYQGYYTARAQFAGRRVMKEYVCLCHGHLALARRLLETPLQVAGERGAWRSVASPAGRRARTEIVSVAHLADGLEQGGLSLVVVHLHTGRLHQIRAHLSLEGHPLVGDEAYGGKQTDLCRRPCLHARRLLIDVGQGLFHARCPLPADMADVLEAASAADGGARALALAQAPAAGGDLSRGVGA